MLKTNIALDGTLISIMKPHSEKRVVLCCDNCGKENETSFNNYTMGQSKNGNTGKTLCKKCACIKSGIAKRGKPIKQSLNPRPCGINHHSWGGGRFIASDGYVQIYQGPRNHRKEHFIVMENSIGRALCQGEIVHHINGIKHDNRLENLALLESESAHRKAHNSLYQLSIYLVQLNLIKFDAATLTYMAVGKLCELLEQPEEVNQQPSLESNLFEGSTTRNDSQVESIPTSAQQTGV